MTSGTSTMSPDNTPRYSQSHSISMHCLQRRTRQGVSRGSITNGVDHADDTGDIDHVTCEHAAILVTPNALSSHWWSAVNITEWMHERGNRVYAKHFTVDGRRSIFRLSIIVYAFIRRSTVEFGNQLTISQFIVIKWQLIMSKTSNLELYDLITIIINHDVISLMVIIFIIKSSCHK